MTADLVVFVGVCLWLGNNAPGRPPGGRRAALVATLRLALRLFWAGFLGLLVWLWWLLLTNQRP